MEIATTLLIVFAISAVPIAFAGSKHYWIAVVLYLFLAFIAMSAMMNLALGFFLASLAILILLRTRPLRTSRVISIMTLWTFALPVAGMFSGAREFRELREKYPMESLSERLAYEPLRFDSEKSEDVYAQENIPTVPPVWHRDPDDSLRAERRQKVLKDFHSLTFSQFVSNFGFGASRMTEIQRHFINYEPSEAPPMEPFPQRPRQHDPPTAIQNPLLTNNLEDAHKLGALPSQLEVVQQFTSDLAWAYVSSRQQAAGFRAHRMIQVPALHGDAPDDWQISRLDLVSLLKFDSPRVYLSEHLPRMDELRNAETRPVNEFEQRGLEQLHGGEDIVVDQQLNTIRMVGAVRAAKQCLDCHSVRRGDLLGAFSYLLDRKRPLPPPKVEAKPVSMRMPIRH